MKGKKITIKTSVAIALFLLVLAAWGLAVTTVYMAMTLLQLISA